MILNNGVTGRKENERLYERLSAIDREITRLNDKGVRTSELTETLDALWESLPVEPPLAYMNPTVFDWVGDVALVGVESYPSPGGPAEGHFAIVKDGVFYTIRNARDECAVQIDGKFTYGKTPVEVFYNYMDVALDQRRTDGIPRIGK